MTPRIVGANLLVRLKTLSRQRSAMFFTIAFPVILVLVFGAIFTKTEQMNFDLPVQDLDQSSASARLVEGLRAGGVFNTTAVPPDTDAVAYARDKHLTLLLIIPRAFGEAQSRRLDGRDTGAASVLTYVYDPSSTSVATKIQYLASTVDAVNHRMTGSRPFITLAERSILTKSYRFVEFFVPGIIAMAVMTSSLSGALNANAELRQKGILRKLATTPITRADWLLSNVLYQMILAAASTTCILLVAYAVFDVRPRCNMWLPLHIVLAVFVFVGIGMLLTPIAREAESASAAANALLFPMMFLSGTFFPVEMMPGFLRHVARGLPLFYVNEGLRASMVFGDDATSLRCAAVTGVVAVVVFIAGAVVTRWDREA
ncbi:MAG: ABC transporter permease [Planctomycetes bacterium]|nr:ABC transporter permease [Planctomycetota bacterium]